jgi:hypothetical protein
LEEITETSGLDRNLRQACLRLRYAARDEYVAVGVAAVVWRAAAGTTATYGGPVIAVLMALVSSSSVAVPTRSR